MSNAEIFLMVWAGLGTLLTVLYRESAKNFSRQHAQTAVLLAEVVTGEVKPLQKDGVWVVENDNIRLVFRKKGVEDEEAE